MRKQNSYDTIEGFTFFKAFKKKKEERIEQIDSHTMLVAYLRKKCTKKFPSIF